MAIKYDNEPIQPQVQQPQQPKAPRGDYQPTPFTGFGLKSRLMGMGEGGEDFEKIHKRIEDILGHLNKQSNDKVTYDVVKILKNQHGLNYSGLAITQEEGGKIAAHVLIVEATGDSPDALPYNWAGQKFNIVRTPSEALDDRYSDAVQDEIAAVKKISTENIVVTDGMLIPREFDINSEAAVISVLENALSAIDTEMHVLYKGYKGFSLSDVIQSDPNGTFVVGMHFNGENVDHIDATGLPIRQDFMVDLKYRRQSRTRNFSVNQGNTEEELVRVYGYVDFDYVGPGAPDPYGRQSRQIFQPNLIITHIKQAGNYVLTPDLLFLGIRSLMVIADSYNWLQVFKPGTSRVKKTEIDFRNIGALNLEGDFEDLGKPEGGRWIDYRDKEFDLNHLTLLANRLIRKGVMISIDVPRAGGDTWFTSIFNYLTPGQHEKLAANRLTTFINTLTSNVYGDWRGSIFEDQVNVIHGGYYQSEIGPRDIRHLQSYLSVANWAHATKQGPDLLIAYTNTLYNPGVPSVIRAAERAQFVYDMSNGTTVFKQTYDRLTFSSAFLTYLGNAMTSAGFVPERADEGYVGGIMTNRSHANYSGALGEDGSVSVFGRTNNPRFVNLGGFTRQW